VLYFKIFLKEIDMDFNKLSMNYKIAGIAGIVAVLGAILPWLSAGGIYSVGGLSFFWGILVFLAGLAAVALAYFNMSDKSFFPQQKKLGLLIAGGIAAIAVVFFLLSSISAFGLIGFGFWLSLVASVAMAYAGFMEFQKN
jgi:peptidoglycan/LPS O-acetylase OafA/YrhL